MVTVRSRCIAVSNQKGGVGKTVSCVNLGIGLAQEGKKVLLIDADPQGSLTISLGYEEPDEMEYSLATLMLNIVNDEKLNMEKTILHHKEDKAVIMTVAGTMNGKIDYNELIGEGEKGMVSVFQETWNEGEAKGIIEMGNDFGLSEEDILARLQKKLNVSLQKAQEYLYAYRKQNA